MSHQHNIFERPAEAILADALAYLPDRVFAMFSGGHDSLCSTHLAFASGRVDAAVHINTGIGIRQTREYVRETCRTQGWPLIELHPKKTYRQIVAQFGFPGPGFHSIPYRLLKERCVSQLVRENKPSRKSKVLLVTGARLQESTRRMGKAGEISKQGAKIWTAPILYWSQDSKYDYMEKHGLPRNEVVDLIHMSGECLCGAFAKPGELNEIRLWFPEVAAEIDELSAIAKQNKRHHKWGTRPAGKPKLDDRHMPLCFSCVQS